MLVKEDISGEYLLAKEYLNGNNESLASLFVQYYPVLVMVAYKYTVDTEKSKDIVSSVFEKMLTLPNGKRGELTLHPLRGVYPLLHTIVKNKCLDANKSRRIQSEIKKQLSKVLYLHGTNNTFKRFEEDAIITLLNNLPKRENEILDLHLKGYKNEEIAEKLNLSYNTVRNTLHSAKQRVKKLWTIFM